MKLKDLLEGIPGMPGVLGMDKADQEKYFEKEKRVDAEMSKRFGKEWNVRFKGDKKAEEKSKAYKELMAQD